jgi:hypothetical protein
MDARAADSHGDWAVLLRVFGDWCLARGPLRTWYDWDLSWVATIHLGSRHSEVTQWSRPLFDAFLAGAWYLVWTPTHLYWVAKPTLSIERGSFGRRLHCEDGPALESEVENLYFWHGVPVPAYAVVSPEMISIDEIKAEENEEVRAILIERFGWTGFLRETNAKRVHRRYNERDAQWEDLYRLDDGTQRFVVCDPSTGRQYALGCPAEITTCEQAQSFISHGLDSRAIHRS